MDASSTLKLLVSPIRRAGRGAVPTLGPVALSARGIHERGRTQQFNLYAMVHRHRDAPIPPYKSPTGLVVSSPGIEDRGEACILCGPHYRGSTARV